MAVVPPPSLPQPAPESPSQSPSDRSKCLPAYGITPPSPHTLTHISPTPSAFSKNLPCDLNVTYTPPNASIPLLPPSEFARMHLEHVTAHPPDSVLFPFLHGLEGDNEAQCTFFAASGAHAAGTAKGHYPTAGMVQDATGRVVRPPRYRGLLWVLCDDDLESAGGDIVPSGNDVRAEVDEGEGEYDTDSSDFSDEDGVEDGDVDMEVSDHDDAARVDAMDVDASAGGGIEPPPQSSIQNTEKYMHPITPLHISTIDIERTTTAHIHMTTPFPFSSGETLDDTALADGGATLGQNDDAPTLHGTSPSHQQHDRRHSDASSGTNSESASTSSSSTSSVFTSSEASGTTSATSLPSPSGVSSACFGTPDDSDEERFAFVAPETTTSKPTCGSRLSPHSKPIRSPPILTSTFLPSQLIQPVFQGNKCIVIPSRDDGADKEDYFELDVDWEFKSGKVPEGISLRNFGVQVPLYTSISDIVVYSPRGASPAALRLAARFRRAIERKLKERVSRWERGGFALHGWGGSVSEGKQQNEAEVVEDSHDIPSGFLKYGVYVLDADAERIERELGWMVVRKEGDFTCFGGCEGRGGSEGCEGCGPGVATEGERGGRTLGPVDHDMEVEVETEVEVKLEGRRQLHPHEQWHHYQHHQQHRLHNLSKSYTAHSRVHNLHTHTPNHELDPNFATCSPNQNYDQGPSPHLDRLHRCKRANTIDFAQREKDEMRDLTRASEIVSVFEEESEQAYPFISGSTTATFWDPRVGQVFLGNASDVPLWTPPVKKKVHPPSPQNSRQSLSSSHYSQSVPSPDLSRIYPASHQQNGSSNPESANTPTDSTLRDTGANEDPSPFDSSLNQPSRGLGFDICIECHEYAPLPSSSHLRAAEEHIRALEEEWVGMWMKTHAQNDDASHSEIPPRPPPHPSAIIHLPFPSSPQGTVSGLNALIPVIRFLERMVTPGGLGGWLSSSVSTSAGSVAGVGGSVNGVNGRRGGSNVPLTPKTPPKAPRLPSPWSPKPVSSPSSSGVDDSRKGMTNGNGYANGNANPVPSVNGVGTAHNGVSPPPTYAYATRYPHPPPTYRPRPLKVLLYSSDGYTESSVPALCLLMAVKGLSLPEAYLEMQVSKRRSFFVYQSEVGLLKRVEARLGVGNSSFRGRFNACGNGDVPRSLSLRTTTQPMVVPSQSHLSTEVVSVSGCASGSCGSHSGSGPVPLLGPGTGRQLTLTIPASSSAPSSILSAMPHSNGSGGARGSVMRRPRASTLPTFISDHQSWFDDARFDGSFPSRVLPFLYLGNLNHASNAYMLHALGITHVVSVGECALVPPPQTPNEGSNPQPTPSSNAQFVAGQGPGGQGSLWIEEREGRIKVLDIKGVCDDGIDTLEPQLHPICTWIEKARLAGGQVLVHCRVGVSRSATVTIAYVMQHLGLSLVEAYLVVRSRRLSVLIQPNMRLLYNLLGWEVRLARERAGGDERRLREELGRALSWPYLAKEVHALNEKYLG